MANKLKQEYWKKIDEIACKLMSEKHVPIIQLIKESSVIYHQTKGSTRTALKDITTRFDKIAEKKLPLLPHKPIEPTKESLNLAYEILHGHYNSTQPQ